jgi:hypothetical protein
MRHRRDHACGSGGGGSGSLGVIEGWNERRAGKARASKAGSGET